MSSLHYLSGAVAGHGLNSSNLNTLYCHDCILPFTLRVCCQVACEETLVTSNEQLLVRLEAADVCNPVIFTAKRSPPSTIGVVEVSRAITVRS